MTVTERKVTSPVFRIILKREKKRFGRLVSLLVHLSMKFGTCLLL